MYDIFFYTFSAVTILTGFIAAFSGSLKTAIHASLGALSGFAGLMILLNSELYSLLLLLVLIAAVSLYTIFFPKLSLFFDETGEDSVNKSPFIYIVIAGLVTALLASLVSSTRWWTVSDAGTNTFMLLFAKYFPVLVLLIIGFSVLISSAAGLIRTENSGGDE